MREAPPQTLIFNMYKTSRMTDPRLKKCQPGQLAFHGLQRPECPPGNLFFVGKDVPVGISGLPCDVCKHRVCKVSHIVRDIAVPGHGKAEALPAEAQFR